LPAFRFTNSTQKLIEMPPTTPRRVHDLCAGGLPDEGVPMVHKGGAVTAKGGEDDARLAALGYK
jgi:hypothetical protein